MIIVVILAGVSVSAVGSIGFVGLVIPHIARKLVGVNYRLIIPMSAFLGAMLLVVADLGARTVNPPKELAIGIMVALVGVPFFLYIARKVGRSWVKKILNTDKTRAVTVTTIFGCISIAVILLSLNTGTLSIAPLKVIQTLFGSW